MSIGKILVFLLIILSVIYGIWWLWQRQPKAKENPAELTAPATVQSEQKTETDTPQISPKSSSVLSSPQIKLEGKSTPASLMAIYSNTFGYVVQTDSSGNFSKDITLTEGFNLILISEISPEPKEVRKFELNYFVAGKNTKAGGSNVVAGPVKNIFSNVLTIKTSRDQNVKVSDSTQLDIPQDEETARSAISSIRIGDYAVAIGDFSGETLNAKSLQILRENKPEIVKNLTVGKVLSTPKSNAFSAKDSNTSQILEFIIDKNTKASNQKGDIKTAEIEKNKNAVIIWTGSKDKKLVSLIYLLP